MLDQLERLSRPVPAAGDNAFAIAVYADATDRTFPAADLGYEGVACVDDAARAVVLFLDLWEATHLPPLRSRAEGLVDFLLYMQQDDGLFLNFIWDWDGRRNATGPTSFPGGGFWHARGVRALAKAAMMLGDERAARAMARGIGPIREMRDVPPDIRSIHALMTIELIRAGRMSEMRSELSAWADQIAALRRGPVLLDNPDAAVPHLWGHIQEGLLAEAGALLGRPDLLEVAGQSALAYLAPLIESGFDEPVVQPYGVASAIYSVERLATLTGDPRFADLTRKARAWFDGRNPSNRVVYDRDAGRVHDGIDEGVLNPHSGAESNIVGAQALFDDVVKAVPGLFTPASRSA
jgi:hypothetical protein